MTSRRHHGIETISALLAFDEFVAISIYNLLNNNQIWENLERLNAHVLSIKARYIFNLVQLAKPVTFKVYKEI